MKRIFFILLITFFCEPSTSWASFSWCSRRDVPLIEEFFTVVNALSYTGAISALLLIGIYKFLKHEKLDLKYSFVYLPAAPLLSFLIWWQINEINFYRIHFGSVDPCRRMPHADIFYISALILLCLFGTGLFFKGKRLDEKPFERFQNKIAALLVLFIAAMSCYYLFYAPRWNLY